MERAKLELRLGQHAVTSMGERWSPRTTQHTNTSVVRAARRPEGLPGSSERAVCEASRVAAQTPSKHMVLISSWILPFHGRPAAARVVIGGPERGKRKRKRDDHIEFANGGGRRSRAHTPFSGGATMAGGAREGGVTHSVAALAPFWDRSAHVCEGNVEPRTAIRITCSALMGAASAIGRAQLGLHSRPVRCGFPGRFWRSG